MSECSRLKSCPFFNDKLNYFPHTAEATKIVFCKDGYKECARFIVAEAIGVDKVPVDLFPIEFHKIEEILK